MQEKILNFVKAQGGNVSFVEFQNEFPEIKGDVDFGLFDLNLLFWPNMTWEFIEAIDTLIKTDKLKFSPCDPLVYTGDGVIMQHSIAKDFKRYESLRWFPIVFSLA